MLAFTPETGKKLVLASYSHGATSSGDAMQLLGIEWYGDLLDALADSGFERPSVSPEARSEMAARVLSFLQNSMAAFDRSKHGCELMAFLPVGKEAR